MKTQSEQKKRRPAWSLIVVGMLALPLSGQAKMDPTNVNINISGTVVASGSCSFSGGNPITVEFGDVYISDIAEGKYRQRINYTVSCNGNAGGKAIQLQISGDGADFDGRLLKTNARGLGIKLLWNHGQIAPTTWYDLNPSAPPILEGELVKANGAGFTNGQEFSATATLKVAYN